QEERDAAAGAGDREPGRDAGHARALGGLEEEHRPSEVLADVGRGYPNGGLCLSARDTRRHLAKHLAELTLEVPDAGLPGVVPHDLPERVVGDLDLVRAQPVALLLPREQVVARDRDLLVLGVAAGTHDLPPAA